MSETTKKAILRALLEGVLTDLYPKTTGEQVLLSDGSTVAAKLTEFILVLNNKASQEALNQGLSGKAPTDHDHELADVVGLSDALAAKASNAALTQGLANLKAEIMGADVNALYDTFGELAKYISEHADVAASLNNAIGAKADKSVVETIQQAVNALGALAKKSTVSESDLDSDLKNKVNAASQGNHSHSNKALLDTYTQTEANLKDAVQKKHSHDNKGVLDGITAEDVASWDSKGRVIPSTTQPSDLAPGDLWVQLVE